MCSPACTQLPASRHWSGLGWVVSAITARLTSASPVLQMETKHSVKSYQHQVPQMEQEAPVMDRVTHIWPTEI